MTAFLRFSLLVLIAASALFGVEAAATEALYCEQFEGPIQKLLGFFSGPIALAVAMGGIIFAGMALIFGGELRDMVKMVVTVALVACLIVAAGNIATSVFSPAPTTVDGVQVGCNWDTTVPGGRQQQQQSGE